MLARYGFWNMMHEARVDFEMLLCAPSLLIDAGLWSLDALLARNGGPLYLRED